MELVKFEENSKYGFRDSNEITIIPAKYEDAKEFKENLVIVKYNGFYGVINSSGEVVIDFIYSSIKENNLFFECKNHKENDLKEDVHWYNTDGVMIHVGNAKVLSEQFLCVSNGYNLGVINKNAEQIINYLYEKIILKRSFFVVLRKGLIGIIDLSGKVIIDAICKSIEQVIIKNDWNLLGADPETLQKDTPSYLRTNILSHSRYNKKYFFDTNESNPSWNLQKEILSEQDFSEKRFYSRHTSPINEIYAPIIITTETKKLLFINNEGILPNSEYEDVQQLTLVSYVVKKNNQYGVYSADIKSLIIPIEYEAIRFYGGHTVLLCKDGFWGAKDLLQNDTANMQYKVSIPTKYLELTILDDNQKYFGCKKDDEFCKEQYYAIIQSNGEEVEFIGYSRYNSQFAYYDSSHIMTSIDNKFGFVGIEGYTSIPFKYDEVRPRNDGRFDVRIGDAWGLLTLDGRDSFGIKLENPIRREVDKNIVVQDAESDCYGVINKDGILIIPAIYEHLYSSEDNNLFVLKYNGWAGEECSSNDDPFAKWGVINSAGKEIVKAKYGSCKIDTHFILAGRGGSNYITYPSDAVYDLYTKDGELLIGGFSEFLYDENCELFFFFFGGEFECGGEHTVWGEFDEHESWDYYEKFDRGTDKWLILDKNLKTVICDEEGRRFQFPKGFIGKVEVKKEGKKKTYVYNMPLKYFTTVSHNLGREMSDIISSNSIIINYGTVAVDITTGKMTKEFSHIEQITDKLFLYRENENVGITNIESEALLGDCFLITRPVSNYIFVAKEKFDNECSVWLYDINDIKNPIDLAISSISKKELISIAEKGLLAIKLNKKSLDLKSIVLQTIEFYENEFICKVTVEDPQKTRKSYHNSSYFIRGKNTTATQSEYNSSLDSNAADYDDHDNERDTWDAMTDGQYGDYPDEGYDGDFEFMGR